MGTTLTGPDPAAATWPIRLVPARPGSRPTGFTVTGGTEIGVLSDGSDASYISQQKADAYFRYNVGSFALPFGARVGSVTPFVRAKMVATNTRNSWIVAQGDHSGAKYAAADHSPGAYYPVSSAGFRTYYGIAQGSLANGQLITQADLDRGLYVIFGLNSVYGINAANPTIRVAEANLQLQYDLPPTATVTGPPPGGTVNDTASPLITWDYTDDFQPQAAYQVALLDSTGAEVYNSGLTTSPDTSHQVEGNLPDGTYTVRLRVYQAWYGPGGAFPALNLATSAFTVRVLRFNPPRVVTSIPTAEQVALYVTPALNLLSYDDSTFDRGYLALTVAPVNATVSAATAPVLTGTGSAQVTVIAAGAATVTGRPGQVPSVPAAAFNALIHVNPGALTGRSAQLKINFRNAAGGILFTATGTVVALPANTWTPVVLIGANAPPTLTAALDYAVTLTGTAAGDALYLDNAAVWHAGGPVPAWSRGGFFETTPNLLTYDDSTLEGDSYIWAPAANSTVGISAAQACHAGRSLAITAASAASVMSVQLGTATALPCLPGETLFVHAASIAATAGRSFGAMLQFTNAAGTSAGLIWKSGTNTTTGWTVAGGPVVVPAGAVSFTVLLQVSAASGTLAAGEVHYLDAISVYRSAYYQGFTPGSFPATDDAPTVVVEYRDDGVHWKELARRQATQANTVEVFPDYTVRSGRQRTYRAWLTETENGTLLTSDYSALAGALLNLTGVWIMADDDPAGTSHQFVYDGSGRSEQAGAQPSVTVLEGRPYGFTEFGTDYTGDLAVSLQLPSAGDRDSLWSLATRKSEVVLRDARGRSVRGVMGTVKFTDEVWGQTASFQLQLSGLQP